MLKLYHGRTSVCSVKARLALAEKGVEWESQLLTLQGDQFDPIYVKLNPGAVVPTLVHDGRSIIESTVIMHYVDDAFPGPSLMPEDAASRAKVHLTTKLGLTSPALHIRWRMLPPSHTSGASKSSGFRACGINDPA